MAGPIFTDENTELKKIGTVPTTREWWAHDISIQWNILKPFTKFPDKYSMTILT